MKIDYNGLISLSLSQHTKNVLNNDNSETLTYYIDNTQGWIYLDKYEYINGNYNVNKNNIRLFNLGHSDFEKNFINQIFDKLDPLIDLDFENLSHNNGSDIDIYSIKVSSNMADDALGSAMTQTSEIGSWWDIFWKNTDGNSNLNANDKNTLVHEIGHVLGL